nr:unnamed protein product [Callosobruchus analis]
MTRTKTTTSKSEIPVNLPEDIKQFISDIVSEQTAIFLREFEEMKSELHTLKVLCGELKESNRKLNDALSKTNAIDHSHNDSLNTDELNSSAGTVIETTQQNPKKIENTVQENINIDSQNEWRHVHRRRRASRTRRRSDQIVGTSNAATNDDFAGATKRLWIYVGKCKPDSTVTGVRSYLERKSPGYNFNVVQLNTKGYYRSYRVDADVKLRDAIYTSDYWPSYHFYRPPRPNRLHLDNQDNIIIIVKIRKFSLRGLLKNSLLIFGSNVGSKTEWRSSSANQVAFLWARTLPMDSAIKLLNKYGILEQCINYALRLTSLILHSSCARIYQTRNIGRLFGTCLGN